MLLSLPPFFSSQYLIVPKFKWKPFNYIKPRVAQSVASLHPGCEEMEREWEYEEEMERDALSTFPHFLYISSLSNHFLYQKLSRNVKYGTFVAKNTKKLTYTQWENNSGSTSLRGSSASCVDLPNIQYLVLYLRVTYKDRQSSYLSAMKSLCMLLSLCEATITGLNNWRCDRWWAIPALQNYPHYRRLDRLTLIIILRAMDIWITSPRDGWISTNAEILTKTFENIFEVIWKSSENGNYDIFSVLIFENMYQLTPFLDTNTHLQEISSPHNSQ